MVRMASSGKVESRQRWRIVSAGSLVGALLMCDWHDIDLHGIQMLSTTSKRYENLFCHSALQLLFNGADHATLSLSIKISQWNWEKVTSSQGQPSWIIRKNPGPSLIPQTVFFEHFFERPRASHWGAVLKLNFILSEISKNKNCNINVPYVETERQTFLQSHCQNLFPSWIKCNFNSVTWSWIMYPAPLCKSFVNFILSSRRLSYSCVYANVITVYNKHLANTKKKNRKKIGRLCWSNSKRSIDRKQQVEPEPVCLWPIHALTIFDRR